MTPIKFNSSGKRFVYVLFVTTPGERSDIVGVYPTRELADTVKDRLEMEAAVNPLYSEHDQIAPRYAINSESFHAFDNPKDELVSILLEDDSSTSDQTRKYLEKLLSEM